MRTICVILFMLFSLSVSEAKDARLTVEVLSAQSGKPVDRASVIVRFRHGIGVNLKKVQTVWETKTNQNGRVTIPTMPQGEITIQVIAANFQTTGDVYQITEPEQLVTIRLNRPQAQYSEDAKRNTQEKQEEKK